MTRWLLLGLVLVTGCATSRSHASVWLKDQDVGAIYDERPCEAPDGSPTMCWRAVLVDGRHCVGADKVGVQCGPHLP